ncbi:MAG: winged helix-turn-helix transcriptional regulator [Nanoarchaeota archaeon]
MEEKIGGRADIIFDLTDLKILNVIEEKNKIRITDLKEKIGLTHANLLTHLNRLFVYIKKERDKQTIYLSLNKYGKRMRQLLQEARDIRNRAFHESEFANT